MPKPSKYKTVKLRDTLTPEAKNATVDVQKAALAAFKDEFRLELKSAADVERDQAEEDTPVVPTSRRAPKSATQAVADARQRLADEEKAFADAKTARKAGKIMAAKSKQAEEEAKRLEKERLKREKEAQAKKSAFNVFRFEDKKKAKKAEKSAFDKYEAIEKGGGELTKAADNALGAVGSLGQAEYRLAKGIGSTLDAANTGDDIASASGAVATSSAGVGRSLLQVFESFNAYRKSEGAKADQHFDEAMSAIGETVGHLINLTRSTLSVAEHSGALEAGSAVPILGIVASIPTLLAEVNDLRSAMTRLKRQSKVHKKLKETPGQETLDTTLKSMMAIDKEAIGKSIAKVFLEFTKIAGHGVSMGGITAPVGIALSTGAAVGKLTISGIGTVEELVQASKAQTSRGKLEDPTGPDSDRNSLKLIQRDPQVAAQVALDQALLEIEDGIDGGPAAKILKSFGIKPEQLQASVGNTPEAVVSRREIRQKMLYKLSAKDDTVKTLGERTDEAKDSVVAYFELSKRRELDNYMEAKNRLQHGSNAKRGWKWHAKMVLITDDVEEKKAALLEQVQLLVSQRELDSKEPDIARAIELLQPRPDA